MGDGKVALILDVHGHGPAGASFPRVRDRVLTEHVSGADKETASRQMLLLLEIGVHRLAVPISMVSRLEEIPRARWKWPAAARWSSTGAKSCRSCRSGALLGIETETSASDLPLQVVVYSQGDRSIGLVVDRIADIVDAAVEVTRPASSRDLLGSAVIQERVTDLLDLPSLVRRADPAFCADSPCRQEHLA